MSERRPYETSGRAFTNGESNIVSSHANDPARRTPAGAMASSAYYTNSSSAEGSRRTRTYAVTQDPSKRLSGREPSHTRRSTMDSVSRPPVIVTTTQKDRPHNDSIHSPSRHYGSPIRDQHRYSDYYALPASSMRSHSSSRPHRDEARSKYSGSGRHGDLLSPHEVDAYRSTRPSVVYPSDPRHSTASIDYGEDGYKYTNAGELVRYDLDHTKAPKSRRHESFDRGYYRPSTTSRHPDRYDHNRTYTTDNARYNARPSTSTRDFDNTKQGFHEYQRDILPAAPMAPNPGPSSQNDSNIDRRSSRRNRPVSLNQDNPPRDEYEPQYSRDGGPYNRSQHDDSYGTSRPYDTMKFRDNDVTARGFGIRMPPAEEAGNHTVHRPASTRISPIVSEDGGQRQTEIKHRPEGETKRMSGDPRIATDTEYVKQKENHPPHREAYDTAGVTGLGILAAGAVGASTLQRAERRRDADEPVHLFGSDDNVGKLDPYVRQVSPPKSERLDISTVHQDKKQPPMVERVLDEKNHQLVVDESSIKPSPTGSNDSSKLSHRRQSSNTFKPNDANDLKQLQSQLAALKVQNLQTDEPPAADRARSLRDKEDNKAFDGVGGQEVGFPIEEKQVRVVSPPREPRDDRPRKGILKQPSAKFPEEDNPIREGVAPHKEDKKLKDVPAGARWTKINRKIVNPEALTIGKERFEVRDDFVIVLRVLDKTEIQAYAAATQVLRGMLGCHFLYWSLFLY